MKNQYVGDVSDFRKYALLRALARESGVRIGVCWMLTPDDDRPDGRKLAYLNQPEKWRALDPELFDLLRRVVDEPDSRRLALIEESGIIPGAVYHNAVVPDDRAGREAWFAAALAAMSDTDLVFYDPDNGVEVVSKPKGRKDSSKFVFRDEIKDTWAAGHSVVVYQHFAREERQAHLKRLAAELSAVAEGAELWAFETAHVAFLLLAQPKHAERLKPDAVAQDNHHAGRLFRNLVNLN